MVIISSSPGTTAEEDLTVVLLAKHGIVSSIAISSLATSEDGTAKSEVTHHWVAALASTEKLTIALLVGGVLTHRCSVVVVSVEGGLVWLWLWLRLRLGLGLGLGLGLRIVNGLSWRGVWVHWLTD